MVTNLGFLLILGYDSTSTDACLKPREQLNVIRIILLENRLAVPFNFISCQVFPEAITLLCLHGCLLVSKPLSFPNDIMSQPVGLRGQLNAWQHSRVNYTTPLWSQEAEQKLWSCLEKDSTKCWGHCSFIQTNLPAWVLNSSHRHYFNVFIFILKSAWKWCYWPHQLWSLTSLNIRAINS